MKVTNDYHAPVLLEEVLDLLVHTAHGIYLDGTLGGGGHFRAMAEKLDSNGILIGIDRDPEAVRYARDRVMPCPPTVILEQSPFSEFDRVLKRNNITAVDGMLLDLGVSSHQIDEVSRGFSYLQSDAALDMRMDPSSGIPAHELINTTDDTGLAAILRDYGEVEGAGRIARGIRQWAAVHPLKTAGDLRACCAGLFNNRLSITLLAKIFQALRIAVNDELGELRRFLGTVLDYLAPGGRLAVIAYHSLEDRMVKEHMRSHERVCTCPPEVPQCVCKRAPLYKSLTKKAIRPTGAELEQNRRSRSARLRVVERTGVSR